MFIIGNGHCKIRQNDGLPSDFSVIVKKYPSMTDICRLTRPLLKTARLDENNVVAGSLGYYTQLCRNDVSLMIHLTANSESAEVPPLEALLSSY